MKYHKTFYVYQKSHNLIQIDKMQIEILMSAFKLHTPPQTLTVESLFKIIISLLRLKAILLYVNVSDTLLPLPIKLSVQRSQP